MTLCALLQLCHHRCCHPALRQMAFSLHLHHKVSFPTSGYTSSVCKRLNLSTLPTGTDEVIVGHCFVGLNLQNETGREIFIIELLMLHCTPTVQMTTQNHVNSTNTRGCMHALLVKSSINHYDAHSNKSAIWAIQKLPGIMH